MTRERNQGGDKGRMKVDDIDALLAENRQRIILNMVNLGKLDSESGMELFAETTHPVQVRADREGFDKGNFDGTPSDNLGTLFCKLPSKKDD